MQPRRSLFAAFAVTVVAVAKPEAETIAACPRCGRVHGKLGDK